MSVWRVGLFALACAVVGYGIGVLVGVGLVQALSDNQHDRSMEAVMTGFFVVGPIAGLLCGVLGGWRAALRRNATEHT